MGAEGRTGILPIPRDTGEFETALRVCASAPAHMEARAVPAQPERPEVMAADVPAVQPLDSRTPNSASLS